LKANWNKSQAFANFLQARSELSIWTLTLTERGEVIKGKDETDQSAGL
jgi:hypothetical protein